MERWLALSGRSRQRLEHLLQNVGSERLRGVKKFEEVGFGFLCAFVPGLVLSVLALVKFGEWGYWAVIGLGVVVGVWLVSRQHTRRYGVGALAGTAVAFAVFWVGLILLYAVSGFGSDSS